jgi:nucleoside-diphosphate-sugar epimerase
VPGRVLVTGLSGFTGPYLRAALEGAGHEVFGPTEHEVDLLDKDALGKYLAAQTFDYVVHLAGIAFVAHEEGADFYRVNLVGTLNLLEAIARRKASPPKKIVLASSANVYGRPARSPVTEEAPPAPLSHYGVSKLAMELMARLWFERLPILVARPFNYTGAGQSEKFVLPKIVAHFRRKAPEIELGETSVVREFMDVRDVAEVYRRLLECPAAGEVVNLCSGTGHRLDGVLETLRRLSGHDLKVRSNRSLVRTNEIPELVGSTGRLSGLIGRLGFRPLEETLRWMLRA